MDYFIFVKYTTDQRLTILNRGKPRGMLPFVSRYFSSGRAETIQCFSFSWGQLRQKLIVILMLLHLVFRNLINQLLQTLVPGIHQAHNCMKKVTKNIIGFYPMQSRIIRKLNHIACTVLFSHFKRYSFIK